MHYHNEEIQKLRCTLSDEQKHLNKLHREQRPFNLLTAILISEEGYDLTTQFFWDPIRIGFG